MTHSIKAIIFDCDGTLVDSEEAHKNAWKQVAQEFGYHLTHEDFSTFVGNPDHDVAHMVSHKIKSYSIPHLLEKKKKYFSEHQKKGFPPISGTTTFLQHLIEFKDQFNLKLAVASAAPKDEILLNLKHLNVIDAFEVILSGQDDLGEYEDPAGVNKPQPYVYLHAAKLLGVSPAECIVIEDTKIGVTAAARAGCLTIAVPTQYSKHHDLSQAHLILESLGHFNLKQFLEVALASKK